MSGCEGDSYGDQHPVSTPTGVFPKAAARPPQASKRPRLQKLRQPNVTAVRSCADAGTLTSAKSSQEESGHIPLWAETLMKSLFGKIKDFLVKELSPKLNRLEAIERRLDSGMPQKNHSALRVMCVSQEGAQGTTPKHSTDMDKIVLALAMCFHGYWGTECIAKFYYPGRW
ncbi:hypothetical protein NDU88_001439 [Pleurodeles waltl]|uniref:Uncharacterized protein n=1 Tax=Pleurodeles waltl TaxID=8319 RepID=A0AAV7L9H4_PLEWA|nr:hypothetical protein NDU88_001439 [Pleurodeles waltl]